MENDESVKHVKNGIRGLEIRVRSLRFTPRGFAEEIHRNIGFLLIEIGYPNPLGFGITPFGRL